ncbi:myotubularin-related protein 10 [Ceratobasidium sp. AG-Ba]|nr:myotubularin-related protein 10 [Ceratobasidium sp. AG-Ba]
MSLSSPAPHRMPYRDGKPRLSPLPSYTNAIEEKHHLTSRTSAWTTTFFIPVPFRPSSRLKIVLPIPQRVWSVTSSRMSRRRAFAILCFVFLVVTWVSFALHKRYVGKEKSWPKPIPDKPPTLVFQKTELQKIWEWEIASGHYPSNRPIPTILGLTVPPPNPGLPAVETKNGNRLKPPGGRATYTIGTGPSRKYVTIKSEPPNVHYPPRPVAGGIADLDIIMDHCDFSAQKYVRDCLELMRIGTGIDGEKRLRRTDLDRYNFIYVEHNSTVPTQNTRDVHPGTVHTIDPNDPDAGLVFNRRGEIEPALSLPPPRARKTSSEACDPDHPRIYHMFWTGEFTDKPYMALMSYLFTQNLGLGEERGAPTPKGLCRPEFWMWINPGPAAAVPNPTALRDMFEGLKFKLWNTTEQLDGIPEIKDEWREFEATLFNSGGVVYEVKKAAGTNETNAQKGVLGRVGSDSAQNYDRMSTILSDMARFILCHRFGGTYLDADTILLRDWEELWGWPGAFAYRWSRLQEYNTAVLRLNKGSALGTFLFRTAFRNGLDFHPMTVWRYMRDAHLQGLLLRLPDALFDSAWLNTEDYQRDRPAFPFFTDFQQFFEPKKVDAAAPNMLGFEGFFRGAYSYHFHNFWWLPFDKVRNYPDLGPRFAAGEQRAKDNLLRKAKALAKSAGDDPNHINLEFQQADTADLSWATVLKRTFESYLRGERPNMYGEWIKW